jgi:cytochrome c peroxidase
VTERRLLGLVLALGTMLAGVVVAVGAGWFGGHEARAAQDPHAGPARPLDRILHAAAGVASATPRAELVAQGRALFRSTSLPRSGESCQGCHTDGGANASIGTIVHNGGADFAGPRDPPALWDVARTAPYFWTGDTPTLEAVVTKTVLGHFRDGATQPADTTARQVAALVAYLSTIEPPTSSFDLGTMSDAANRGELLFQGKAGCASCHFGPDFTDGLLHDTGVPQASGADDPGIVIPAGRSHGADGHAFDTPTLRDVRDTGPYMHNGVFATLEDVVAFYDTNPVLGNLDLTPEEQADLVAYLKAL